MKEIKYNLNAENNLEILSKGAFLTTMANGKINTMTIGWGSIGYIWGKPVFMAMVRTSRFTHELIEQSGEFTITIPTEDMKQSLGICGSKSGRDMDKLEACGLKTTAAQNIKTPIIDCAGTHFECKVLYKTHMEEEKLDAATKNKWYDSGNFHTLYFAEIIASYEA